MELAQKDQLLETCPRVRLGLPIMCKGLSVPCDEPQPSMPDHLLKVMDLQGSDSDCGTRTNLLFTMSYRTGSKQRSSLQTLLSLWMNGGAGRDRTDDPLLAKQVLSQLSYGPIFVSLKRRRRHPSTWLPRHEARRTSFVQEWRACERYAFVWSHILASQRSIWWAWEDLNLRPHAYQARALTN
jgi:hypothetical protein